MASNSESDSEMTPTTPVAIQRNVSDISEDQQNDPSDLPDADNVDPSLAAAQA